MSAEMRIETHTDADGFQHRRIPCGSQMYDECGYCGVVTPPMVPHQCRSKEARWLRRLTVATERAQRLAAAGRDGANTDA